MISASSSEHLVEFARIIPEDSAAERALDLVYDDDNMSPYHRSFIQVERITKPEDSNSDYSASERRKTPDR